MSTIKLHILKDTMGLDTILYSPLENERPGVCVNNPDPDMMPILPKIACCSILTANMNTHPLLVAGGERAFSKVITGASIGFSDVRTRVIDTALGESKDTETEIDDSVDRGFGSFSGVGYVVAGNADEFTITYDTLEALEAAFADLFARRYGNVPVVPVTWKFPRYLHLIAQNPEIEARHALLIKKGDDEQTAQIKVGICASLFATEIANVLRDAKARLTAAGQQDAYLDEIVRVMDWTGGTAGTKYVKLQRSALEVIEEASLDMHAGLTPVIMTGIACLLVTKDWQAFSDEQRAKNV